MNDRTIFIYENSVGRIEFSINSTLWITDIDGVSSVEIDLYESRNPSQIGSSLTSQSVKPRTFTIDGALFDPVDTNRELVLRVIAPQIPATLTFVQDDERWYLDVVPERTPEITPGVGVQFFQTRLRAAYPYWRTIDEYASMVAGLIKKLTFPFYTGGEWYISEFSGSYFAHIENAGNVPTGFDMTITARGELTNPELYHMGTHKKILIQKTLEAGDTVVVSTVYGKKGVVCTSADGVVTNGFRYLSIDSDLSMELLPGDNLLRSDAQNRVNLDIRITAPRGVKSGV